MAHIREKARFDVARIEEIEAQTKHDVIAFLTNVAEYVGEDSRYLHYALTSSDILDTALALRLRQAADILLSRPRPDHGRFKRRGPTNSKTPSVSAVPTASTPNPPPSASNLPSGMLKCSGTGNAFSGPGR